MSEENQDIYKVGVSILMIHIMLIFVFEGFALAGQDQDDTFISNRINAMINASNVVDNYNGKSALIPQGVETQEECESYGGIWDNNKCFDGLQKSTGIDFNFFDLVLGILKLPLILGNFILFIGATTLYPIILSFRLIPIIPWVPIKFLVGVGLWFYQSYIIYYLWALFTNWRGQR